MESRQHIDINNFQAPVLNLDQDNSNFHNEKVVLKNALNLNIEGTNSGGYFVTNTLSNEICFKYPKDYILNGKIALNNQEFLLCFKTPTSSEIGILRNDCTYEKWVNDPCLNFNPNNWITGFYKFNKVCDERSVYINDGLNPDRIFNIDRDYPKVITGYKTDACKTPIYSNRLDCDELLSNQKVKFPCIKLEKTTGILSNGKYQVALAYSDNKNNYTDYFISDAIIIYGNNGGLEIELLDLDITHDNYKLVLIGYTENGQFSKLIGIYNTRQNKIIISNILAKQDISTEELFTSNSHYLTSKHSSVVNNQLIKSGLIERSEIYYQPQANKIKANWVVKRIKPELAYKYPQYLRDEVYSFFIQWIAVDGYKYNRVFIPNNVSENVNILNGDDYYEPDSNCENPDKIHTFWAYNTATITSENNINCDKLTCEQIIKKGEFAYFQSEELFSDEEFEYKNRKIKYWGDLACKPIKLHKFPDNCITNHYYKCEGCDGQEFIDILGIEFSNIEHPKDLDGNYIKDIIGYRILRGDRNGHEIILSKGLFNNFLYDSKENQYFQNFPYNSLEPNSYISTTQTSRNFQRELDFTPMKDYSKRLFSYLSPETSYTLPQVGNEISLYGESFGNLCWKFQETYKHPKHVLLTTFGDFFSVAIGVTEGILKFKGSECKETTVSTSNSCTNITGMTIAGFPITPPAPIPTTPSIISIKVEDGSTPLNKKVTITLDCNATGVTATINSVGPQTPQIPPTIIVGSGISITSDVPSTLLNGSFTIFDAIIVGLCPTCNGGISTFEDSSSSTNTSCTSLENIFDKNNNTVPSPTTISPISKIIKILTSAFYGWEATKNTQTVLKGLGKLIQYGWQFDSIANYNRFECGNVKINNKRRGIVSMDYLPDGKIQIENFKINNSNRVSTTYVLLNKDIENTLNIDNSRFNFEGKIDNCKLSNCCDRQAVSYYGAIKRKNFSPYGQLEINTIPISCWNYIKNDNSSNKIYKTEPLFNGDTFISKFSIKNHFQLFLNLPIGEDPEFPIDYRMYGNIGFPRFWANTIPLNVFSLKNTLGFFNPSSFGEVQNYNLDCDSTFQLSDLDITSTDFISDLFIKNGKFYTSVNGVFNYYVESSYLNDYRKKTESLHYPYQAWEDINRSDKQILDNRYEYDQFLRSTEISEQSLLQNKFEPETCNKSDYKIIYSEPDDLDDNRDNWKIFRPLSFTQLSKKDGNLTTIHAIDDNNLLISFEDKTYITQAEESLLTKSGTPIYLGSGDIFSRRLKPLTEDETGYTGSVDKFSFLNTRYGTTWVDRKRKKIFLYSPGQRFKELSNEGINQWLQFHLSDKKPLTHSESIKTIYDNHFDNIFYTYKSDNNENYTDIIEQQGVNVFNKTDCSWTLSYKPNHGWVSFHSFIPTEYFTLPNDFLSANNDGIWKHNKKKSYHIFYDKKEPYFFSYIIPSTNSISQSIQIRHETITEANFNNQIYHNDVFFDKFMIFSERTNSGLKEILLKDPKQITSQNTDYQKGVSCDYNMTNYWSINNYRNFAINQPHYQLNCDGHTFSLLNIKDNINPNQAGNIEGNWFQVTLMNTLINDKRFKTFLSINTKDKIKTNK